MIRSRAPLTALLAGLLLTACASAVPDRDPTGETFPTVDARALSGERLVLPDALAGAPAILLVGYVMDAQFDLDRWLVGLAWLGTPVAVREVPTIDGLVPGLFAGRIDEGMRGGIPAEDWGSVLTVYDDADRIVAFTGDEHPRNGRVLLIDAEGTVAWFHDRGFSAGTLMDLDAKARELAALVR